MRKRKFIIEKIIGNREMFYKSLSIGSVVIFYDSIPHSCKTAFGEIISITDWNQNRDPKMSVTIEKIDDRSGFRTGARYSCSVYYIVEPTNIREFNVD